ncbi:hypothetical protein [Hymenobacter antarcticus]|uniref:Uncharacterized protein n=1 Tax=Hymenobacter antarcticus TaxID=486270 RepID=A0ABP7R0W1_9BACT
MKKVFFLLMPAILLTASCARLDRGQNIHADFMDFVYLEDHNQFVYKSRVNAVAHTEVFLTTRFRVDLPKNLKNWQSSGNVFVFEYDKKQIIYIQAAYKNKSQLRKPTIREVDNKEIDERLSPYWDERKYHENTLKGGQAGRVSKVYSDGRVVVLLYNVKQENFDHFLSLTSGLTV